MQPDIVVHTNDTDKIVQKLLGRFRQIGDKLLCVCKENLPAATPSDAIQTMRKTLSSEDNEYVCQQTGLVNMDISQSGVVMIE